MDLFEINNGIAFPTVHALLTEPFKTIWEEDKTDNKSEAIKIFTYVELVCSPKKSNPFHGYGELDRPKKVRKEVWKDENYNHPAYLQIINAVMTYKNFMLEASPSYSFYLSSVNAYTKYKDFLDNFDLEKRTNSGAAVYKPMEISKAIQEGPDLLKSIEAMRVRVNAELDEVSKTRKDREIGLYER